MQKLICTAHIFFITGLVASDVGETIECSNEPTSILLVLLMFSTMAVPAVLGYLAGKEDSQK